MAKKILLADDSITIQKVVELTFSEGDYEVISVSNGAQAIHKVEEIVPDIALVDVMMPQRNGYEVCAHVKSDPRLSWIPVLLLTGTFEPFDPRRAEQAGADGHITKPFESRALVTQVEDLIAAHPRPRSAEAERQPIAPVAAPERTEIVSAGQIFTPGGPPGGRPPAADASPATVRLDSKAFFAAIGGADVLEPPQPPEATSLGPLDLADEDTETEPTHPVRMVPPPAPRPARPQPQAPPPPRTAPSPPAAAAPPAPAPAAVPAPSKDEIAAALRERIDAMVRPILQEAADRVLREVAWEVIPEVAEALVRRRIRELEEEAAEPPPVH